MRAARYKGAPREGYVEGWAGVGGVSIFGFAEERVMKAVKGGGAPLP